MEYSTGEHFSFYSMSISRITGQLKQGNEFVCNKCGDVWELRCGQSISGWQSYWSCWEVLFPWWCHWSTGRVGASVSSRIRDQWGKFMELLLLLTSKALPMLAKGRIYHACVRSVMLYETATWPVMVEDMRCMERNYMK